MESRRENLVSPGEDGPKRERKRKLLDQNFVYDFERNVGFKQSWKNQVLADVFVQLTSLSQCLVPRLG